MRTTHPTRTRAGAVLAAAAVAATCAVWAAPAAHAATCVELPGSTIGTDLSIGGQDLRVPAISDVTLCASTATAPIASVTSTGGTTCDFACLSVLVGGTAQAEGLTISYREDGVLKTTPVKPPPVPGPAPSCVLSVGSPDAPYPDCFIAIGPELKEPVNEIFSDLYGPYATALDAADPAIDAAAPVCDRIPDQEHYYNEYGGSNEYDFCEGPAEWVFVVSGWW